MGNPIYRRIQNTSARTLGSESLATLEAAFVSNEEGGNPFLIVRILGFDGTELFSNEGLQEPERQGSQTRSLTLKPAFEVFVRNIENLAVPEDGHIQLFTPYPGVGLEVCVAPVRPREYVVYIYMYQTKISGNYCWRDSGTISVILQCNGDNFLEFLRQLEADLGLLASSIS